MKKQLYVRPTDEKQSKYTTNAGKKTNNVVKTGLNSKKKKGKIKASLILVNGTPSLFVDKRAWLWLRTSATTKSHLFAVSWWELVDRWLAKAVHIRAMGGRTALSSRSIEEDGL